MHHDRIKCLNVNSERDGDYVLYWMQSSVRSECNHALEYAIEQANRLNRPLLSFFGLTDEFPEANLRHYIFLLEGLREAQISLEKKRIRLIIRPGSPVDGVVELSAGASMIVVDRSYTRTLKTWRQNVSERVDCPLIQVEGNVVVPVEAASSKEEYAAYTLRPKIGQRLDDFQTPLEEKVPRKPSPGLDFDSFDVSDVDEAVLQLKIDGSVGPSAFHGSTSEAVKRLRCFVSDKLDGYAELRNDPTKGYFSGMSPYLHFGQISPLHIALSVGATDSPGKDAYLEELIVRRELAVNLVHYNPHYDSMDCIPDWCRRTLDEHREDKREYEYSKEEFEGAQTHDPYWNSAQTEMVVTGKMHGYMRMYWGKKIIEWSDTPEQAYMTALYLNNKYELDGRDPNGYSGVAWCFGKHDRPWKERPIFGKIRYMNERGLRRKFDANRYVEMVELLG